MKIDMNDAHEKKLLCSLFSCTLADLDKAVDNAGKEVEDVSDYFAKNRIIHNSELVEEDISLNPDNSKDIHFVCTALGGCTRTDVDQAIKQVGQNLKKVKSYLKKNI